MIKQIYTITVSSEHVRDASAVRKHFERNINMPSLGYGILSVRPLVLKDADTGGSDRNTHAIQLSDRES